MKEASYSRGIQYLKEDMAQTLSSLTSTINAKKRGESLSQGAIISSSHLRASMT